VWLALGKSARNIVFFSDRWLLQKGVNNRVFSSFFYSLFALPFFNSLRAALSLPFIPMLARSATCVSSVSSTCIPVASCSGRESTCSASIASSTSTRPRRRRHRRHLAVTLAAASSSLSPDHHPPSAFRPCIDIHKGKVKQIVGSTLSDLDKGR